MIQRSILSLVSLIPARTPSPEVGSKIHLRIRRRSREGYNVSPDPCSPLDLAPTGHHESWGQSSGAMSAALQMVTNGGDTEDLFRGAFMESGAVIPSGDISLGQRDYDDLVRAVRCSGAEDTLECLRQVPFPVLKEAVNMSPGFLSYRVGHNFLNPSSAVFNPILQ